MQSVRNRHVTVSDVQSWEKNKKIKKKNKDTRKTLHYLLVDEGQARWLHNYCKSNMDHKKNSDYCWTSNCCNLSKNESLRHCTELYVRKNPSAQPRSKFYFRHSVVILLRTVLYNVPITKYIRHQQQQKITTLWKQKPYMKEWNLLHNTGSCWHTNQIMLSKYFHRRYLMMAPCGRNMLYMLTI